MKKRTIVSAIPLVVLVISFLVALEGCGSGTSSRSIDAEQFTALQQARNEVSAMIAETAEAADPNRPLPERLARIEAVLAKHEARMPQTSLTPTGPGAKPGEQVAGTVLRKLLAFEMQSSAAIAADSYLRAANTLYGLRDFEQYLLKHTVDNGTAVNPADPPENMETSQTRVFSGGVGVRITYDPSNGQIKWILGENPPDYRLSDSSVPQIEAQFIKNAQWWWTQGGNIVLDDTRL